ncbi:MAG: nucleotidyltransferase domain-containing protein [Rhodothermales bacterium]
MTKTVQLALDDAHVWLRQHYGERLSHVVLYGSHARGDARPDSDVDVLVVLKGTYDLYTEIKQLVQLQTDLLDRYGELVAFQPYSEAEYQQLDGAFMTIVREEGLVL